MVDISRLQSEFAANAPVPRNVRIAENVKASGATILYNFDQGQPARENYPRAELIQCFESVLGDDEEGWVACTYNDRSDGDMRMGHLTLRTAIAKWMERRHGKPFDPKGIMLANGSTQSLALAAKGYLDKGDGAIVEINTFPYMRNFIKQTGAQLVGTPVDDEGVNPMIVREQLKQMRDEGVRPKLIYTIPTFQTPSNVVMPLNRRHELLELAEEWDLMIIEDNCYYFLGLEAPPPPSLLALDTRGRVLQSESFSKYVAPGLRLAWMTGTPEAIQPLLRSRQDLGTSNLMAHAMAHFVREGMLDRQLAHAVIVNRRKRDVIVAALKKYCGSWVDFRIPTGGLNIWLKLSDQLDFQRVREECLKRGVACRPGEMFSDEEVAKQYMRLAYLHLEDDEIERGIQELGEAMRSLS